MSCQSLLLTWLRYAARTLIRPATAYGPVNCLIIHLYDSGLTSTSWARSALLMRWRKAS